MGLIRDSTKAKASVLFSVYNEPVKFLRKAIKSILNQTFKDFEFIILDDGSSCQETICLLESFSKEDKRIVLHKGPNRGLTKSLNIGLGLCSGDFVCRQDSDDWSEPERLDKQIKFLEQHPKLGMVGSNITFHQENGKPLWNSDFDLEPDVVLAAFRRGNPFCHGAVCFRRKAAEAVGGYREFLFCSQDHDLFLRICERYGGANLPESLYHLRRTANSISARYPDAQAKSKIIIRKLAEMRRMGLPENIDQARKFADQTMPLAFNSIQVMLKQADFLLLSGHCLRAFRKYTKCVVVSPCKMRSYLKLLRCIVFILFSPLRKWLFTGMSGSIFNEKHEKHSC